MSGDLMEFKAQIIGLDEIKAKVGEFARTAKDRIREIVRAETIAIQADVKEGKLSGQVLNVQTGRLRRSITHKLLSPPDAELGIVGTNVSYGRFWELGFQGTVNVRAHLRAVKSRNVVSFGPARKNSKTGFFVKKHASGIGYVGAHQRTINQAARPFLRPTLEEHRAEFQSKLLGVLGEVL